jgi:hypothetical protein
MEVLDTDDKTIPGLYAAGSTTGCWESESYCYRLTGHLVGFALNYLFASDIQYAILSIGNYYNQSGNATPSLSICFVIMDDWSFTSWYSPLAFPISFSPRCNTVTYCYVSIMNYSCSKYIIKNQLPENFSKYL